MNKRDLAKFALKTLVQTTAGSAITKTMIAKAPVTEKAHMAEVAGAVGGYYAGEQLQPHTDQIVDDFFDRRELKKNRTK